MQAPVRIWFSEIGNLSPLRPTYGYDLTRVTDRNDCTYNPPQSLDPDEDAVARDLVCSNPEFHKPEDFGVVEVTAHSLRRALGTYREGTYIDQYQSHRDIVVTSRADTVKVLIMPDNIEIAGRVDAQTHGHVIEIKTRFDPFLPRLDEHHPDIEQLAGYAIATGKPGILVEFFDGAVQRETLVTLKQARQIYLHKDFGQLQRDIALQRCGKMGKIYRQCPFHSDVCLVEEDN